MFISDEIFEEIFKYYQLSEEQSLAAIERIRSEQVAIFFLEFFKYYEEQKSPREQKYLQTVIDKLSEIKDIQKVADVVYMEFNYNPELKAEIRRKLEDYSLEMIFNLIENMEESAQRKVLDIMYREGYQAQKLKDDGVI